MKVYVVLNYPYLYGDGVDWEYKDILTHDNPKIVGIFSTLVKAKRAFKKEIEDLIHDTDIDYANRHSENNYEIREFDLDDRSGDYHACKYLLRFLDAKTEKQVEA